MDSNVLNMTHWKRQSAKAELPIILLLYRNLHDSIVIQTV